MEFYDKNKKNIDVYVKLGAKGHYPLFPTTWINTILTENKRDNLNAVEKIQAKSLFKKICKYNSDKKRKVIVESLNEQEKKIFLKAFMKMIESDILDENPYLH